MSDETDISPNAKEIKARAADWLQRRNFWNWTAENEAEFADWLNASLAHRAAYVRVEAAWKRAERLTVMKRSLHPQAERAPQPARSSRFWFFGES